MMSWSELLFPSCLIFLSSTLCYLSSLDGDFVFDDHRAILTNDDLDSSKTSLWEVFQHDFWGGSMARVESHKSYRPLTVLTYRYFNFYFSGLQPYSYHAVNVLLHSAASLLVFFLSRLLFGDNTVVCLRGGYYSKLVQFQWSTFTGLMFAVHSIHTEAVASVVGRAEVVCCIFFLLSILTYCRAISNGCGHSLTSSGRTRWNLIILSLFFSFCSMLSKEQGIVAIGICAFFDGLLHWQVLLDSVFFVQSLTRKTSEQESSGVSGESSDSNNEEEVHRPSANGSLADSKSNLSNSYGSPQRLNGLTVTQRSGSKAKKSLSLAKRDKNVELGDTTFGDVFRRVAILVAVGVTMMWFRLSMNYNSQPIFKEEELKAAFHPNRTVRMMSFSYIYAINAWLLLSPSALCCDWSLGSIPLITSPSDPANAWSLLLYLAIILLSLHILLSSRDRVPSGMGVALLVVAFLPASGALFRVGFVIAERVLYLPSLGLCVLVGVGARRLYHFIHYKSLKRLLLAVLLSHILLLALKTHSRSKDWASDFLLFESGVRVNPSNVKLRNNYGIELKSRGRAQEAKLQFEESLAIDPQFGEVYMNLGNLMSDDRNYEAALKYFETGINMPHMYHKVLNNLATTYFRLGRLQEAESRFKESIKMNPNQPMTYNNLASLYGEQQKFKESEKMFRKALKLNPTYTEAYFNLGTLFIQMADLDKGEQYLNKALKLHPGHSGAINNLKVIEHYRRQKK